MKIVSGQTPLSIRLLEIKNAVADGAHEIDIVISRTLALQGDWEAIYHEVRACREACGEAHLKTIIATGELGCLENVYKAGMVSMMAGSDFIKTSTGKEGVNAIFPVALVMVRSIREYLEVSLIIYLFLFLFFILALILVVATRADFVTIVKLAH